MDVMSVWVMLKAATLKKLEEYLACAFVGVARETGYEGEEDERFVLDASEL